jgi:hypothetical protein
MTKFKTTCSTIATIGLLEIIPQVVPASPEQNKMKP